MIPITVMAGKTIALFGLGGSGVATAKAVMAGGAKVIGWDDNTASVAKAELEGIDTQDLRDVDWSQFSALVLAPGVPLTHPKPHWSVEMAIAHNIEIIGDIELFVRERKQLAPECPFIAITGTNGKSTTTALIAHIIRNSGRDVQMGGNIGQAVLTLEPPKNDRFYVVECSSYQIDLAPSLNPSAGILLNLTPDHLDRHGSMGHYAAIKERLIAQSDVTIIGDDDDFCRAIIKRQREQRKKITLIAKDHQLADGFYADGDDLYQANKDASEKIASLAGVGSLRGAHNAQNALAAIAACLSVGLTRNEIKAGLSSFPGLAHRMEQVGKQGKILFVNDSKATNAEATAPALSTFPNSIYWIAGGVPKAGGIASLEPYFSRITKAYLIGEAAEQFAATLDNKVSYEITNTLTIAVENAARDAAEADAPEPVVLLSPSCASFDQFPNFEKRGDAFRDAVMALANVQAIGGN